MIRTLVAATIASICLAGQPAMADVIIKIKPRAPVVKRVIVTQPCYYKTVKKYHRNKVTTIKTRVCP